MTISTIFKVVISHTHVVSVTVQLIVLTAKLVSIMAQVLTMSFLLLVVLFSFIRRLFQLKTIIDGAASETFIRRLLDFVDDYSTVIFDGPDDT